ncbi:MAG: pseudaminic acid cytidylyltransferase [Lachnospiraceae bacterium]|nr:pseudaminic acid cytidylyltransferase [Lachnospiraceae bacterium]
MSSSIAIITARGGSRRIPGKNIKSFCGKPIIAYSIEAALQAGCFDKVMVSTDSDKIADIAKKCGAEVPFLRSSQNADDHATTADVIAEVLDTYAQRGEHYDRFLCLYPTAPFVTAQRLCEAVQKMEETGADAVVPVVRFSFPPQRGFILQEGKLAYKWPQFRSSRSQDLEPFYHDAGQFYLVKEEAFRREQTVVPAGTVPIILPETQVQDIDNPDDWEIAEIKFRRMQENMH